MTDEDLAPALGGERAQPLPPPPPPSETPVADAGEAAGETAGAPEVPPELAALLEPFGRLAELLADRQQAGEPARIQPDEAAEALARGMEVFLGGALREISQRLPATLAAFEGLVESVEQAITPILDEMGQAVRQAGGAESPPDDLPPRA